MSHAIGNRIDTFMARPDVQRFQEVSGSVLKSAASVALVALLVFTLTVTVAIVITMITLAGMVSAGSIIVPIGVQIGLATSGMLMGGGSGAAIGAMPYCCEMAVDQCKETHQLIWNN